MYLKKVLAVETGGFQECLPGTTPTSTPTTTTTQTTSHTTTPTTSTTPTSTPAIGTVSCVNLYGTSFLTVTAGTDCRGQSSILEDVLGTCPRPGYPLPIARTLTCDPLEGELVMADTENCEAHAEALALMASRFSGNRHHASIGCAYQGQYLFVEEDCEATASVLNAAVDSYLDGSFVVCGADSTLTTTASTTPTTSPTTTTTPTSSQSTSGTTSASTTATTTLTTTTTPTATETSTATATESSTGTTTATTTTTPTSSPTTTETSTTGTTTQSVSVTTSPTTSPTTSTTTIPLCSDDLFGTVIFVFVHHGDAALSDSERRYLALSTARSVSELTGGVVGPHCGTPTELEHEGGTTGTSLGIELRLSGAYVAKQLARGGGEEAADAGEGGVAADAEAGEAEAAKEESAASSPSTARDVFEAAIVEGSFTVVGKAPSSFVRPDKSIVLVARVVTTGSTTVAGDANATSESTATAAVLDGGNTLGGAEDGVSSAEGLSSKQMTGVYIAVSCVGIVLLGVGLAIALNGKSTKNDHPGYMQPGMHGSGGSRSIPGDHFGMAGMLQANGDGRIMSPAGRISEAFASTLSEPYLDVTSPSKLSAFNASGITM